MSRMDYYVQICVCGYVFKFFWSRSELIQKFQAYKCIFMGNGFWSPLERKRKSPVGKINGLTQVTPSTIAYAVAQVCFYSTFVQVTYFFQARFALSSCEEWGVEDGQFILQDFYEAILELFEDEEDEWVVDTLTWWNK